jgi:hypothetical protein
MRFLVSPGAKRQLAERQDWWREHRLSAPDLFDREFADLVERIRRAPESFPIFVHRRDHIVRRGLMRRTRCHLYFELRADANEIWLVAAGGGQRLRPPRLRFQETP